ncbi:uncharacterized protein LOC134221020 [Armigeres subalbatus]|uniref:uncharacterized protein LOC134221020 n=1 Tax=Armigeres subalbatus TaxID=124917 RepID=UPI002ED5BC09
MFKSLFCITNIRLSSLVTILLFYELRKKLLRIIFYCSERMGKCTFRVEWLKKIDPNGCQVSDWARNHGDTEVFCKVCSKSFSVAKGFQALEQHSLTDKHKDNWTGRQGPSQLRLCSEKDVKTNQPQLSGIGTGPKVQLFSPRDSSAKAELIWLLKCIASDFPAASCDGIADIFAAMFPNIDVSGFSLSRTKARYLATEALAPYFRESLLNDARNSMFTLCYDETTNSAGKKELQTAVRYWSSSKSMVKVMHLQTFFIGSAKAEDILEKLLEAMQNASLPLKNLIMLGSDGPNVNKKVERLMNERIMQERGKSLLLIGSCNIHILHNAFLKGIEELGEDASELVYSVHHFFHGWPSREEDMEKIQINLGLPTKRFIKHVSSRWLTLEGAAERLLEQWTALIEYFLNFIPKKHSALSKSSGYLKIYRLLTKKTMKAEVLFVSSSAHIFTKFTGFFQKEEPLVHIMYTEIDKLARTLIGRVCKPDACSPNTTPTEDIFDKLENLLPVEQIIVGSDVTAELSTVKEVDRGNFFSEHESTILLLASM